MGESTNTALLVSLILAVAVPILAGLFVSRVILVRLAQKLSVLRSRPIESTMPYALRLPVLLLSILIAVQLASLVLRQYEIPVLEGFSWDTLDLWVKAAGTLIGFWIGYRLLVFGVTIAGAGTETSSAVLIRKVVAVVFGALALVTVLGQFKVEIGPVLASLGVAGLAVALALQDTLSNYFAGILIAADKPVRPGDYIRLEDGLEGFVESIGWRTTRIKPWGETNVIIPNSKLASSILTNNYYPDLAVRVYVKCGVSYESDLDEVERICVEVGKASSAQVPGADVDWEPIVRYDEFGDSNVTFSLILRAVDFKASYLLKHETMKALHRRFREEGIVINYPVRDLRGAVHLSQEPHE